jgi:hypothetical protein
MRQRQVGHVQAQAEVAEDEQRHQPVERDGDAG